MLPSHRNNIYNINLYRTASDKKNSGVLHYHNYYTAQLLILRAKAVNSQGVARSRFQTLQSYLNMHKTLHLCNIPFPIPTAHTRMRCTWTYCIILCIITAVINISTRGGKSKSCKNSLGLYVTIAHHTNSIDGQEMETFVQDLIGHIQWPKYRLFGWRGGL